MENYCLMKKTRYELKEGTKNSWVVSDIQEIKEISEEYYNNIVSAKSFFKSLGGSENHKKTYTKRGYKVTKITSKRPDRIVKVVYEFIF